ncbi:hypothetical protein LINPERHAP1_LOCUS18201 [Linum perenne]
MSCFLLPKTVTNIMNSKLRDFFWGELLPQRLFIGGRERSSANRKRWGDWALRNLELSTFPS